jgi:hypothetical protein
MRSGRSLLNANTNGELKLFAEQLDRTYTYEQDNDKRNEGPPQRAFVPEIKTMVCPEGRLYCAHNCMCMRMNVPACQNSIGEVH